MAAAGTQRLGQHPRCLGCQTGTCTMATSSPALQVSARYELQLGGIDSGTPRLRPLPNPSAHLITSPFSSLSSAGAGSGCWLPSGRETARTSRVGQPPSSLPLSPPLPGATPGLDPVLPVLLSAAAAMAPLGLSSGPGTAVPSAELSSPASPPAKDTWRGRELLRVAALDGVWALAGGEAGPREAARPSPGAACTGTQSQRASLGGGAPTTSGHRLKEGAAHDQWAAHPSAVPGERGAAPRPRALRPCDAERRPAGGLPPPAAEPGEERLDASPRLCRLQAACGSATHQVVGSWACRPSSRPLKAPSRHPRQCCWQLLPPTPAGLTPGRSAPSARLALERRRVGHDRARGGLVVEVDAPNALHARHRLACRGPQRHAGHLQTEGAVESRWSGAVATGEWAGCARTAAAPRASSGSRSPAYCPSHRSLYRCTASHRMPTARTTPARGPSTLRAGAGQQGTVECGRGGTFQTATALHSSSLPFSKLMGERQGGEEQAVSPPTGPTNSPTKP